MPRRHKAQSPDTRLDWRDPNMPVLGESGRPIDHRKMQEKAKYFMLYSHEPHYTNDPTYNLRKPKR